MFVSACFLLGATFTIALLCLRLARKWRLRRSYERRHAGPCYLCGGARGRAAAGDWAAHRRKCAAKNAARLSALYRHPWARCPLCGDALALLPCSPHDFECQNAAGCCSGDYSSGPGRGAAEALEGERRGRGPRMLMNCGDNRFNCFECDFDVCKECIEEAAAAMHCINNSAASATTATAAATTAHFSNPLSSQLSG